MRVQPDGEQACRIEGQALDFRLAVRGLDAAAVGAFLGGTGSRPEWPGAGGIAGVSAELLDAGPGSDRAPVITHEFDDGRLETRSGGPGRVIALPGYRSATHMLPQSLHLLLAQQWAQAGILTLHSAAVSTPQGGVLILGSRGAGKSVLSLSARAAGLGVVTDDWMLLGRDRQNRIQAERLRAFMMLRQSWAVEELGRRYPGLSDSRPTRRPKQVIAVPGDNPEFPASTQIDRIWLLRRPRGARSEHSRLTAVSTAHALGQLVEASMPLLFSTQFDHEHQALLATARGLIATARGQTLETGTDLIEEPKRTWSRLLDA